MQFIAATHSPLIAIGAGQEALTLRFDTDKDSGEVTIQRIEDLSIYDVDQVLRSPAFGLVSTYSPQTQEKIDKYHQLNFEFPNLDPEDKREYEELRQFMKQLPSSAYAEPGELADRINKFLTEKLP